MSFGLDKVYTYPAVEYIPLAMKILALRSGAGPRPRSSSPALTVSQDPHTVADLLQWQCGAELPPEVSCPPDRLLVLARNLKIWEVKYRAFTVTMPGEEDPGAYLLFSLPTRHFYKSYLFFEVCHPSGRRLAWARYWLGKR
ncbi:MAG: hypothetical protein QJR13_03675 [Bacillota bacterium]|nr:hypothetical protein [Bacillota bacterium]